MKYLSVNSNGVLVEKAEMNTPNAVAREWSFGVGTPAEKKGIAYEILHEKGVGGKIKSMMIEKGTYGEEFKIVIQNETDLYQIQLKTDSQYFDVLAKKLPNVDMNYDVTLYPYSFLPSDATRLKRGFTVVQNGNKLQSFYYDAETKSNVNGFPTFPSRDSEDFDREVKTWSIQAQGFLVSEIRKRYKNLFDEYKKAKEEAKSSKNSNNSNNSNPPVTNNNTPKQPTPKTPISKQPTVKKGTIPTATTNEAFETIDAPQVFDYEDDDLPF